MWNFFIILYFRQFDFLKMSKVYSGVLDQKYQAFFNKYKQAHPDKPGIAVTAEVVKIWKEKLNRGKDEELYKSEMVALEEKVQKVKKKGNICNQAF